METVHVNVTNACNLSCKHCYINAGRPLSNELTLNEFKKLFADLYELGVFQLVITGGEPFCRHDIWQILELAEKMDFCLYIETNTSLLKEDDVLRLKDLSISQMHIPLEGLERANDYIRGRGHFQHTTKTIDHLRKKEIPVEVRVTATKISIDDLKLLTPYLIDLGVNTLFVSEFTPTGRGLGYSNKLLLDLPLKKKLHSILEELRSKYHGLMEVDGDACGFFEGHERRMNFNNNKDAAFCGAINGDFCVIMSDGVATPCDQYVFYGGNIRLQSIKEIIDKSPVFMWFRSFDRSKVRGVCGKCEHNSQCGGCRIFAFLFNGDFNSEDPMCWRTLEQRGVTSPLIVK